MGNHVLEPATQEFADAAAIPLYPYELEPDQARKVLDNVQAIPLSWHERAQRGYVALALQRLGLG